MNRNRQNRLINTSCVSKKGCDRKKFEEVVTKACDDVFGRAESGDGFWAEGGDKGGFWAGSGDKGLRRRFWAGSGDGFWAEGGDKGGF